MIDYEQFEPTYIQMEDGQFAGTDVEFWIVEGYPVADVLDGKTGMVALFGRPRTFPLDAAYENGWKMPKDEFFKNFPETRRYFERVEAKAA